jgi:lysophospholipase L1-like esterase
MEKLKKTCLWKDLVVAAASLVLGFGLCESIARSLKIAPEVVPYVGNIRFVDNLKMVYELVPGSFVVGRVINKQGFNDADFTFEKPDHQIRIAMLGDSITQGIHVPLGKTFSDRLEELLNQKAREEGSLSTYEVMNFGVGGYNLEAEVEVLKEKALAYDPDIVILNLFFNDNEPIPGIHLLFIDNYCRLTEQQQISVIKKYVAGRDSLMRRFEKSVLYKSSFYLLLRNALDSLRASREKLLSLRSLHGSAVNDMSPISGGFQEIGKLKKQYGFKFLICLHPHLLFYEHPHNTTFASLAGSSHFDSFSMFPYYEKEALPPGSLQVKGRPGDTCHPNELGHALIAKAMFFELKKRRFIDIE